MNLLPTFKSKMIQAQVFLCFIIVILLILLGSSYRNSLDGVNPRTPKKSASPSVPTLPIVSTHTSNSMQYELVDGSVYSISPSSPRRLVVDNAHYKILRKYNNIVYQDDGFRFVRLQMSPDKEKMYLLGEGSVGPGYLFYTFLGLIHPTYIDSAIDALWSNNSRYIAYISKPTDAGGIRRLGVYDITTDKNILVTNKPSIPKVDYDHLEFGPFRWLDDDSGILVHYTAFKRKDKDSDPRIAVYGAAVGEGEVILPVVER